MQVACGVFLYLQILFSVRAHGVEYAVECFAFAGELVLYLGWMGFIFFTGNHVFVFEELQLDAEGARRDAGKGGFQFAEPAGLYEEVSHDEDDDRITEQIGGFGNGTVFADILALFLGS